MASKGEPKVMHCSPTASLAGRCITMAQVMQWATGRVELAAPSGVNGVRIDTRRGSNEAIAGQLARTRLLDQRRNNWPHCAHLGGLK